MYLDKKYIKVSIEVKNSIVPITLLGSSHSENPPLDFNKTIEIIFPSNVKFRYEFNFIRDTTVEEYILKSISMLYKEDSLYTNWFNQGL